MLILKELQSLNIRAGAVLLDLDFAFQDGKTSPKWVIVLSDNLLGDNIIFTLTTSQVNTYSGSLRRHIFVKKTEEKCFEKDCIIEIERTFPMAGNIFLNKFRSKRIEHKGFISESLLKHILNEIAECDTVSEYIKISLKVYDY